MIYLVEHFYSIQGEGRYLGTPSLFFRFGGCNMRCEGFGCEMRAPSGETVVGCDTIYAVDKREFQSTWTKVNSSSELIAIYEQYDLPERADVVFTGGEPLLYADDEVLYEFVEFLHVRNIRTTFETNATIDIDFMKFPMYKASVFALSVKLENSAEPYNRRIKPDVIFNISRHAEAFFKFSIDDASIDISLDEQMEDIIAHAPTNSVYCMPVGSTRQELEKNSLPLIEYVKVKGYNYSDRLHIRIWNQKSGV